VRFGATLVVFALACGDAVGVVLGTPDAGVDAPAAPSRVRFIAGQTPVATVSLCIATEGTTAFAVIASTAALAASAYVSASPGTVTARVVSGSATCDTPLVPDLHAVALEPGGWLTFVMSTQLFAFPDEAAGHAIRFANLGVPAQKVSLADTTNDASVDLTASFDFGQISAYVPLAETVANVSLSVLSIVAGTPKYPMTLGDTKARTAYVFVTPDAGTPSWTVLQCLDADPAGSCE
jgi:hypothetical protein